MMRYASPITTQLRQPATRPTQLCVCMVASLLGMTMLAGLTGCQKTALRPDDQRSQYDRYDQARNQRAQPYLEDEYGRRTPNLSGRLIQKEQ